ncbi:hypothetical protein LV457_05660 [Mycobacterium sp. MYCO198283]|uniref:hypothetical protein n=1 Tax=Mycobacterium sp. MYCO198283 TaxID=2883505 RepID=UPI001E5C3313|nr:hypothetical protein [Mycobacterium sp. MYCO198283]MCG5431778.1 hypothetical protein [Mycobacterium sp. MYCO198283]
MSDTDARLADILARYESTLDAIDTAAPSAPAADTGERTVLRPADRQRGYRPPTFGSDAQSSARSSST